MPEIVLLVGEHPEENPLAVRRARQVKKLLEQKGHRVVLKSLKNPFRIQSLARKLDRIRAKHASFKKSCSEAFQVLDEYASDFASGAVYSQSVTLREAEKEAGKHVFSFHTLSRAAGLVRQSASAVDIKWSELNPRQAAGFDSHIITRMNDEFDAGNSSVVLHNFLEEKGRRRVVGIVENLTAYAELPLAESRRSMAEAYVLAWNKKRRLFPRRYIEFQFDRLTRHSSVEGHEWLLDEAHARSLAEKIHELVAAAESR